MEPRLVGLSKTVSHALRHRPWLYELELDDQGWTSVEELLAALRQRRESWHDVSEADLAAVIAQSEKRRFELRDGRIRALYGHSVPGKLAKKPAAPPTTLYHGTTSAALPSILNAGLQPMRRQYVHLSVEEDTAQQVARRKGPAVVVLAIRAAEAHQRGVPFYEGNEMVWLADHIPPEFIEVPTAQR